MYLGDKFKIRSFLSTISLMIYFVQQHHKLVTKISEIQILSQFTFSGFEAKKTCEKKES